MKVGELFAVLGVDMTQYEKDLAVAQTKARTAGSIISDIFKNAVSFTVGMGLWETIQQGFRALVGTALDFNVMMQNAKIGFETMLGSAQKAQDFLDKMGKFAAATPFEYPDLLEASRRLMAFGYAADDVLPIVKSVGDAVAALGGGREQINNIIYALGQMRTAGRLNAQDMMQLTNAGIPAWEILAEKMGKSVTEVRKLSEQGLIPAAQAVPILIEGMEKRFPNMMSKMQDTWLGVTSTIKDVWRMTIGAMTQNLFQGLNNWLKGVRDWATQFYAAFQQGGLMFAIQKMFGSDVATVVSVVAGALKTLWNVLVGVANFVKTHWATLKPILIGVLSTLLYFKTAAILQSVFISVANGLQILRYNLTLFAMGLRDVPGLFGKISAAIKMLTATNPVFLIITAAIAGVIVAGVLLYKNWDKVRYYGLQAWGALKIGIAYVAYAIVSYYKIILGWIPILGQAFNRMQQSLASSIAKEKSILSQRAGAFTNDNSDAKTAQNLVNNQIKLVDSQKQIANASSNAATGLNKQADATKKAGKATQDNLQSFDEVHQIMQETAEASKDAADNMKLPEVQLPAIDTQNFGNLGGGLSGFAESITGLGSIWDGIVEKWNGFKEKLANFWDGIKEKWDRVVGYWNDFKAKIRDFWNDNVVERWNGFKEKIATYWDNLKEKWGPKWEELKQSAAKFGFDINQAIHGNLSPLKEDIGKLWDDIKTNALLKWEDFKTFTSLNWDNIKGKIKEKISLLKTELPMKWEEIKTAILTKWDTFKNSDTAKNWEEIKEKIKDKIALLGKELPDKWQEIKTKVLEKWEEFKNIDTAEKWEGIKNKIKQKWGELKNETPIMWQEIKKKITDKWDELKIDAPITWGNIKKTILNTFNDNFIADAFNWGKNLIQNIIDGINSMKRKITDTVSSVAHTIAGFLGFHSPTELGPGRDADKWAPNLMKMYAQGIINNTGLVKTAVNTVAESLTGIAISPAFAGSMAKTSYTPIAPQPQINLHIGTLIADDYGLKQLEQKLRNIRIYEDQRLGADAR